MLLQAGSHSPSARWETCAGISSPCLGATTRMVPVTWSMPNKQGGTTSCPAVRHLQQIHTNSTIFGIIESLWSVYIRMTLWFQQQQQQQKPERLMDHETPAQTQPSIFGCAALRHQLAFGQDLGPCAPRRPWREELVGPPKVVKGNLANV